MPDVGWFWQTGLTINYKLTCMLRTLTVDLKPFGFNMANGAVTFTWYLGLHGRWHPPIKNHKIYLSKYFNQNCYIQKKIKLKYLRTMLTCDVRSIGCSLPLNLSEHILVLATGQNCRIASVAALEGDAQYFVIWNIGDHCLNFSINMIRFVKVGG